MEEKRMVIIGVGAVLVIMTTTLLAVTQTGQDDEGGGGGNIPDPVVNRTNPLLLISLDGFRSEYINRGLATLESLKENGVWTRLMLPSYPTLTFPNHYTIVTGLYPESHGIVSNDFYDPDKDDVFSMGVKNGTWWGGEPIWNTLTLQNKTSATFFWPGSDCDIGGLYPTHYFDFDSDVPYVDRVNQVLEWLSLPEEERPDFVSLYFEEPDSTGHKKGPESVEVDQKLFEMDGWISRLLQGLRQRELIDKVNIIVLADHGMARTPAERILNLTDYYPDVNRTSPHNYYGAFTHLRVDDTSGVTVQEVLEKLSCPAGVPMRAYVPEGLPKRFHYSNNKRIGDVVLDLDAGYTTRDYNNPQYYDSPYIGNHGYDNYLTSMGALFIASGPDFMKGVELEPFQNIEVYNLMCHLLDVDPAPNDGTEGALYGALLNPPPVPDLPDGTKPTETLLDPNEITDENLKMANCSGDLLVEESNWWKEQLLFNETEAEKLEEKNCPWGVPLSGNKSDMLLLHHKDHVTGYSEHLKMPLWTSFTVTEAQGTQEDSTWWNSDVRLNVNNTPLCNSYDMDVDGKAVMKAPLFHPVFSTNASLPKIPYLVSNAVPLVTGSPAMDTVTLLADTWKLKIAPLNLVIGLAFDYDADSLPDDTDNATIPAIPSHFFLVTTRCRQLVSSFDACDPADLDTLAFIFPHLQAADNTCLTGLDYAAFHLATVRDVELLTGLIFFPGLEPEDRLPLTLNIPTYIWRSS